MKLETAYLEHVQRSGVLDELDSALHAKRFVRTGFSGAQVALTFAEMPDLRLCRQVTMSRAAVLRVAAESGDWSGFSRAWDEQLRLTHIYSHDPHLISHLVAESVIIRATDGLGRLLIEHDVDSSLAGALLVSLGEDRLPAPLNVPLEGERLLMYDLMQRCYSDDGHGDGLLLIRSLEKFAEVDLWSSKVGGSRSPVVNVAGLVYPGRAETKRTLDEFLDAGIRQSTLTRAGAKVDVFPIGKLRDQLPEREMFLRLLLPAFDLVLDRWYSVRAKIDAARLMLRIEIYEARHGEPPHSLDDLVPGRLPVVPIDAASGKNFVYMRREATPDDPRRFLLYSVGADGEDNGGVETVDLRPDAALDARTDPKWRDGYDYIFNRLREPVEEEQERIRACGSEP